MGLKTAVATPQLAVCSTAVVAAGAGVGGDDEFEAWCASRQGQAQKEKVPWASLPRPPEVSACQLQEFDGKKIKSTPEEGMEDEDEMGQQGNFAVASSAELLAELQSNPTLLDVLAAVKGVPVLEMKATLNGLLASLGCASPE